MSQIIPVLVRSIMLTAYLVNTHMVIQPIFYLRHEIQDVFDKMVYPILFIVIPFTLIWVKATQIPIGFTTRLFYYLCLVMFVGLIRNVYGILFGLSSVFFISEYWEIPVYLYRLFMTGEFLVYDNVSQLFVFVGILSKLSNLAYIIFFMHMLGINWEKFLKLLASFTVIYVPLVFFILNNITMFPIIGGSQSWIGWGCRIICMGLMWLYMLKYYDQK